MYLSICVYIYLFMCLFIYTKFLQVKIGFNKCIILYTVTDTVMNPFPAV